MTRKVRFTIRNLFALLVLGAATFGLAACKPNPAPAPPPAFSYDDTHAAIAQFFGPYGPGVQGIAECIAGRESGWNPYAVNGQYRGVFQLGRNFQGTVNFYGGDFFDPYQNTQAARDSFVQRGNFSAFSTARGCGA